MNYQCDTLTEYIVLLHAFRDAELRAEIINHRDTCPTCIALREATIERRRTANLHREVPVIFPAEVTERLANVLRSLYKIVSIRPGDIGWPDNGAGSEGGGSVSGIRTGEPVGAVDGDTTESEVSI